MIRSEPATGATVGDAVYSTSPETEAGGFCDPLGVGQGKAESYMDDSQRRSRIYGGSAIMALKQAQVWLVWYTCWVRRVKDLNQTLP